MKNIDITQRNRYLWWFCIYSDNLRIIQTKCFNSRSPSSGLINHHKMFEAIDSDPSLAAARWVTWQFVALKRWPERICMRNANSISWLVIIKDIAISCIFICHILDIGSVTHLKRTLRTLYKGKIIREFCRILTIGAANFHVFHSRGWHKKLSFCCRLCVMKMCGFSIIILHISSAH